MASDTYKMQRDVQEIVRKRVEDCKNEVIGLALKEFEERLRRVIGDVAVNIANYYSIQTTGTELIIRVQLDGPKPVAASPSEVSK